ncbi:MAG: hypothetical protein DWC09_07885 [Candidatus Poseidoniales archaeon]|nr:MAG: hypothetical protein DWC09_07885 [Candidatus Poseidoniales archaeon]
MMTIVPIITTVAVVGGLSYYIFRSRKKKNMLLSAAARREKHAPKESLAPRRINSKGKAIEDAQDEQSTERLSESRTVEEHDSIESTNTESSEEDALPISNEKNAITELSDSSRQIDELSKKERKAYDKRDQERDENLMSLRLLVEDLFDDITASIKTAEDTEETAENEVNDDEFTDSTIELRTTWIEQNEEPLNQHAALVEAEEIGSGIQVLDSSSRMNDDIDERLLREGGKTGEVQVSLAWDDYNDLDLHIFCPSGERIYFNNKTSECGGELDVDMNVRPTSKNAVENVVWIKDAPIGKYKVGVHFYKHHKKEDTTDTCLFRARITIHGAVRDYSGQITHGQAMQMVTSFTLKEA